LLMGCFLPPVAIILMVTPIIMRDCFNGFDPIWFGIITSTWSLGCAARRSWNLFA
jgi:TRAP-type C4-dicarboxylate transport system permease large subunit